VHWFFGFSDKLQKKKKLTKDIAQATADDTACQMPAVRRSDDPVTAPVF